MLSLFGHSSFAYPRKLDQDALETVIEDEERNKKKDHEDEWDEMLSDSQSEGEGDASRSKGSKGAGKRRQAGFAVDNADLAKPTQAKKKAKAKVALAESEAGEKTDKTEKPEKQSKASSQSGKGKDYKELDNELQVIARQHLAAGGSSIESLQDLTVEWFLENCKSDEKGYTRSSKLRGATCYNLGSSGVSGAIVIVAASFDHA